jgi:hypothetical protein
VEPYITDTYLPDLQVMAARSFKDSAKGFYLAAKGGNNAESHNHNDVGNFIVYYDGLPLLIDVGVETYTSKTFSSKRYEIWTMQSQYHNLPAINGVQQKDGKEYRAEKIKYNADSKEVNFSMELSKCYPSEAMLNSLEREITLKRGKEIIINDSYNLKEWKAPYVLYLMTCCEADCSKEGKVVLSGSNGRFEILYDRKKFSASSEEIKISDERLSPVWGSKVTRVILTSKDKKLKDEYKIELQSISE